MARAQKPEGMSPLAVALRDYLDTAGVSVGDLSKQSGVPRGSIYTLLRADRKRPPVPKVIEDIAATMPADSAAKVRAAAQELRWGIPDRPKRGTPLQMLIIDRMRELDDLSFEDVVRRCGGAITKQSVANLVNGATNRPQDSTVAALVKALELPESQIRKAIADTNDGRVYELPPQAQTLTAEGWDQVQGFIDYMLKQERERGL